MYATDLETTRLADYPDPPSAIPGVTDEYYALGWVLTAKLQKRIVKEYGPPGHQRDYKNLTVGVLARYRMGKELAYFAHLSTDVVWPIGNEAEDLAKTICILAIGQSSKPYSTRRPNLTVHGIQVKLNMRNWASSAAPSPSGTEPWPAQVDGICVDPQPGASTKSVL